MPTKERMSALYSRLIEAALDQPKPTQELREALTRLMAAGEYVSKLAEMPQGSTNASQALSRPRC